MAGPTTESLDVDVKGLREDLRRVEVSLLEKIGSVKDDLSGKIGSVKDDLLGRINAVREDLTEKIGAVKDELSLRITHLEVGLGKFSARLNMVMGILGLLSTASLGVGIKSLADGAYWAGSQNVSVKALDTRMDKLEASIAERSRATDTRLDKLDARFGKLEASIEERSRATDARLDKLTASIAKILEQTKPPEKP